MSYIPYALSLLGVPYGYWSGMAIPRDDSTPFYASHNTIPTRKLFEVQGICCTGFINLLRRVMDLPVPGVDDPTEIFPGGTGAWYKFLEPYLEPYDKSKVYPDGTLLFRPYKDFTDQGHIALVHNNKTLHSYAYIFEPHTVGTVDPGVSQTEIWHTYYVYAAPPHAWLQPQSKTHTSTSTPVQSIRDGAFPPQTKYRETDS
jgi:hypothetical protein